MKDLEYEVRVGIRERAKVWPLLVKEIPAGAELVKAQVVLTPLRARVDLTYFGRKPDGVRHLKPTTQSITLATHFGEMEFLLKAFPSKWVDSISSFLPGGNVNLHL